MSAENAEQLLISAILATGEVFQAEDFGVNEGFFHTYATEYAWLIRYHLDYKVAPSKAAFRTTFPDFPLLRSTDVEYACELVRAAHLAFRVTSVLKDSAKLLRANEPHEALSLIYRQSTEMARGAEASNHTQDFIDHWGEHFDTVMDLANRTDDEIVDIPFGFPTVDERTLGLQPGTLNIFAARLNQGKSWNLVHTGAEALMKGKKVLVYSLEMSKYQIESRFMASLAHRLKRPFTHSQIRTGRGLDLIAYKQFLAEMRQTITGNLHVYDTARGGATPLTIAASLASEGADLVLVDYLTLLSTSAGKRALESWNEAAMISAELKEVARRFHVPIVAAAQINREGDRPNPWKPPKVKNLAQSDNIGQDADVVITMSRSSKGTAVYSLEKNRDGEAGFKWHSRFFPDSADFGEVTYDEARDLAEDLGFADDE